MATRGRNPNYWIVVSCPTQGIEVVADMPETFGFHTSSSFDSPKGTLVPTGPDRIVGGDAVFQALTKRIWTGTTPISISLDLLFDATTNAQNDVHRILVQLAALALPNQATVEAGIAGGAVVGALAGLLTKGLKGGFEGALIGGVAGGVVASSGLLTPPNPTNLDSNENKTAIRIGRQWRFDDMVIDSATISTDQHLNAGFPIAGAVRLECTTDYVFSKNDLYKAAGISMVGGFDSPTDAAAMLSPVQALRAQQNG